MESNSSDTDTNLLFESCNYGASQAQKKMVDKILDLHMIIRDLCYYLISLISVMFLANLESSNLLLLTLLILGLLYLASLSWPCFKGSADSSFSYELVVSLYASLLYTWSKKIWEDMGRILSVYLPFILQVCLFDIVYIDHQIEKILIFLLSCFR